VEIGGLRIAFLSGHFDIACYDEVPYWSSAWPCNRDEDDDGDAEIFKGACYKQSVLDVIQRQVRQRLGGSVDILLSSEWPDQYWSTKTNRLEKTTVEARYKSPAVKYLFFNLKPRYHVCAAADQYAYRKAPQGHYDFHCTSLAFSGITEAEEAGGNSQRWCRPLALTPQGAPELWRDTRGELMPETGKALTEHWLSFLKEVAAAPWEAPVAAAPETPGEICERTVAISQPDTPIDAFPCTIGQPVMPIDAFRCTMRQPESPIEALRERIEPGAMLHGGGTSGGASGSNDEALPPGWVKQFSRTCQKPYYVEPETGISQWHHPQHPAAVTSAAPSTPTIYDLCPIRQ